MKKRILCLLLVMLMLVSALSALTACGGGGDNGGDEDPCANGHTYTKADGVCDVCKKKCKHKYGDDKICDLCSYEKSGDDTDSGYPEVPWINDKAIELFFMMSKNSSGESLPSGCERYLAGEDPDASETLDQDVWDRNSDAEFYTNVKLKYDYYADTPEYGWGKCHNLMYLDVATGGSGKPDMYANFTYDMVAASIKGSFANLKNTELDQGNFFSFLDADYQEAYTKYIRAIESGVADKDLTFDDKGYMYDYMQSVTLSQTKMYLLASDYFIDMVRAFYVVPVNVALLESVGMNITGDWDESGSFTIDDFYLEVEGMQWTYKKVMDYSAAVYRNTGTFSASEDIEDVLGWCSNNGGFVAPGFIYSTDITVINKIWDEATGDYKYSYPSESTDLYELFDALRTLHQSTGVYCLTKDDENFTKYGSQDKLAIAVRERFCDNKILFGGIIMVGALEVESYQKLKGSSGFGVVPVPLYKSVEEDPTMKYLTSIHNAARPGAIARTSKNFTACTAFLDYQSTHSTHILDAYYNRHLCVNVVDNEVEGTIRMLRYIRSNVRSAFDKTFEDALGVYTSESGILWTSPLSSNLFEYDIRQTYKELADKKTGYLNTLYLAYFDLP